MVTTWLLFIVLWGNGSHTEVVKFRDAEACKRIAQSLTFKIPSERGIAFCTSARGYVE